MTDLSNCRTDWSTEQYNQFPYFLHLAIFTPGSKGKRNQMPSMLWNPPPGKVWLNSCRDIFN